MGAHLDIEEHERRVLRKARAHRFVATGYVTVLPGAVPAQLGGEFRTVCEVLGLDPRPQGWTILQCQEHDGSRWTVLVSGTKLLDTYTALRDLGLDVRLFLSGTERNVHAVRPGWVIGHGDACPLLPAAYDPPGTTACPWE